MSHQATIVFTFKSVERILAEGGTSAWRLDRNRARQCKYVVCTRNAKANEVEGPEAHHSAFLVGKVKGVAPKPGRDGRFIILMSEYARVDIPDVWKGDRNPVKYETLEELEIDPYALAWEPMPPTSNEANEGERIAEPRSDSVRPLSLLEAKKGLALAFGVAPDAIEITIRG
jgi:hypothetical protein